MRVLLLRCAWLLLLLPMLSGAQFSDQDCTAPNNVEFQVEQSPCKLIDTSVGVTLRNNFSACTVNLGGSSPFLVGGCNLVFCEILTKEKINVQLPLDSKVDELQLRLLMKFIGKTFEVKIDNNSCPNCRKPCGNDTFFAVTPKQPLVFLKPSLGVDTASPTNSPSASVRPSAAPTPLPTKTVTGFPTISPTKTPSKSPTEAPTETPTFLTVEFPTSSPSQQDSNEGNESLVFAAAGGVLGILAILILLVVVRRTKKKEREIKQNPLDMAIPPPKGKHLTMSTLPSVTSAPKLNSTQLNYVRFSTSTQNSRLSHLLKNEFSNRNSVALRLSAASAISSFTVSTYKSKMSNEMMERSRKFKALSSRLSSNYSRINELLGMAHVSQSVKKPTWTKSPRELVKQVCDRLQGDILSAAEVEKLDSVDPLPKFSGEAPPVDLEFYLFRLVNALNSWFDPDGNNEMVGMRSLMFSIIYLRKIKQTVPLFGLTEFNVHRIFAILLLVAAKFTEDELISNAFWGDACGLTMEEVNKLEEEFCFSSEFNFFVTPQELDDMATEFNLNIPRESINLIDVASRMSF